MYDKVERGYIEKFEELLETTDVESLLEQEDLSVAEALFLLFDNGHIKSPFYEGYRS
jgi:hypothetical protein